jgi:hypothetical protein
MAQDNQKFVPGRGMISSKVPGGFQSEEAEEKAAEAARVVIDDTPPQPAVVPVVKVTPEAVRTDDAMKPTKVKPRQTILRMRVGPDWYSFIAGKECIVPKHVERLLEEKGLL